MASLNSHRLVTRTMTSRSQNETKEATWAYNPTMAYSAKLSQGLRGKTICRVCLRRHDSVAHVPASRLAFLEDSWTGTADGITYVDSAARAADALTQEVLLTPIVGPQSSAELAPVGKMHMERGAQAPSTSVAGDSAPSCHPG